MKTNIKKSLKFVTLLISALLISFVSAQTFSELYMRATPITVTAAKVYFVPGANTTDIGQIFYGGTEVNFTGMQVKQGETQIYHEAVNITNQASATKTIKLTVQSTSGNLSAFNYVNVSVIDESGTLQGTPIYLSPSSSNNTSTTISMGHGKTWAVRWEISAATYAEPNTQLYITIKLTVED